ncbi:hypothetical protein NHX12_006821 [Muraenolepis orangiensis]|uniref:Translationally-controlled tumor protein homolog n=1 Tax=Muraenolepis orangiensis TaxID=630683 RepID=A0A9Q0DNN9_9TELE|nr:hypothetical protein NHX12_006821 [Muraenolepis orangiensis]
MLIYKDLLTGDELFTDIYKIKEIQNGFFLEVEGLMVSRCGDEISDRLIGGNQSLETQAEDFDRVTESGVDIVLNSKLQETRFSKADYKIYIKTYVNELKAKLKEVKPDREGAFAKAASESIKHVLGKFSNFQFFIGESMNPSGMVALLDFREDGQTPFFLFFKDGLEVEKA